MKENKVLASKLNRIAYVLSGAVLLIVGLMRRVKVETAIDFSFLPPLHASFNAIVAVLLVIALVFIKKGDITNHKRAILAAMVFSALFLLSYVVYHFTTEETSFCQEGTIRYVYFFFLISHVILAAVSLPFILFTFIRGFTYQVALHKKMARWVWPIWFYVAITGPICYMLLKPCY
jgi:putative membrane protein